MGTKCEIDSTEFTDFMNNWIQDSQNHLSPRILLLLNDWLQYDLKSKVPISYFEAIIKLIVRADLAAAHIISELLPIIDSTCIDELEKNTFSNATAFVRDYLKNDFMLKKIAKNN